MVPQTTATVQRSRTPDHALSSPPAGPICHTTLHVHAMLYEVLCFWAIVGAGHHQSAAQDSNMSLGGNNTLTEEDRPRIVSRRQHISDFTDPETGKNPFLDLIEGPSGTRGGMQSDWMATTQSAPLPLEGDSQGRRGTLLESATAQSPRQNKFPNVGVFRLLPSLTTTTSTAKSVSVKEEHQQAHGEVDSSVLCISLALGTALVFALCFAFWLWRKRKNRFLNDPEFAIDAK